MNKYIYLRIYKYNGETIAKSLFKKNNIGYSNFISKSKKYRKMAIGFDDSYSFRNLNYNKYLKILNMLRGVGHN